MNSEPSDKEYYTAMAESQKDPAKKRKILKILDKLVEEERRSSAKISSLRREISELIRS